MTSLGALLGEENAVSYTLVDETPSAPTPPPDTADPLVAQAFQSRRDLRYLNENFEAARKFSAAERDLTKPTIAALGTAGGTPERADQITSSWYGAVGVNVSIPLFNGFLYSARAREAEFQASAARQQVAELRQSIARDIRAAVLQTQSNFQRIAVTRELLDQANTGFDLRRDAVQDGAFFPLWNSARHSSLKRKHRLTTPQRGSPTKVLFATLRYETGQ